MSHLTPGLIGAYNSLTDKHLTAYFNNLRIRRHLQRVGMVSRSGRIVSEKEFMYKIMHKDQQRRVRECLAQAVFHQVLDMERLHQTEIRRKLEEISRRDRVNKIKVACCNRYEDEPLLFLWPRPPTRLKSTHTPQSGLERVTSDSTDSLSSSRQNSALDKTRRPVRLKPLHSNINSNINSNSPTSIKRNSSCSCNNGSSNDVEQPISCRLDRDVMRHITQTDFSSSVSPYRLPVISQLTPAPPRNRKDGLQKGTLRGRRLRPTTAPGDSPNAKESAVQRAWSRSLVWVKMVYFGRSVHLSPELMELRDEVKVFQQHCGGQNLCVYKGTLKEGESFKFMSRRPCGFPFSLTFYLNGLQVERLSSCCEFKHRKSSRHGGRHTHFGFSGTEGATPCYRCIIAMGLDKKHTKTTRDDPLVSWEIEEEEEQRSPTEFSQSHDTKTERTNQEQEHKKEKVEMVEMSAEQISKTSTAAGYEEDFEAVDEGSMNNGVDEGNKTSPPLSREEDKRRTDANGKLRRVSSVSTGLSSNSSSSEEDEDEFDEEQKEEVRKPKIHTAELTSERDAEETEFLQTSSMSLLTEDETLNQRMDHNKRQDKEAEEPGEEPREEPREEPGEEPREEPREKPREKPREEPVEVKKSEENLRKETAVDVNKASDQVKCVQEKFAEAVFMMTECVSEPELSDSTTEEDEMVRLEIHQLSPGAETDGHVIQQTDDGKNGAERKEAQTKEPTEKLKKEKPETPQPGTNPEEQEKDRNHTQTQPEVKTQNATNEDEAVEDEQNNKDDEHKDQKAQLKQNTTGGEGVQNPEDNKLWNKPAMIEKTEDPADKIETENASETRATPVEGEVSMMELTEHQPKNPARTSGYITQNTELEKWLSDGEDVSFGDQVTEEIRADEEETRDEESRNLRNPAEETGNNIPQSFEEENVENKELESKGSFENEVKEKDKAGEAAKSEERVEEHETERGNEQIEDRDGVETDMMDAIEEAMDQVPQDKKEEMMQDRTVQQQAPPTSQTSKHTAEDQEGEREEEQGGELAAENDGEMKAEQKSCAEDKDAEEEELKMNKHLDETDVGENECEHFKKTGEKNTEDGGADGLMKNIELEQNDESSDPTVHEAVNKTKAGHEEKPGGIENREEIMNVHQEGLDKMEAGGQIEVWRWSNKISKEEIHQDMMKREDVKDEQIRDENDEVQSAIHQETNEEEDEEYEEQEVAEEEIKQKPKKETTNKNEVKAEQKDEVEIKHPENAESEPRNTNVLLESGGEEQSREDGNQIEPTSVDATEESRIEEESRSSLSEESQPLEKVLLAKREERQTELIIAPRTDHEDLVSNWVNLHQASNYFKTFVELLDDMKVLDRENSESDEALDTDQTQESHRNEESPHTAGDEQNSLVKISEHEELQEIMEEILNLETEALGAEGQRNPLSRNPSEEENQIQMDSEQTPEDQRIVPLSDVMNISAASLMNIQISQKY